MPTESATSPMMPPRASISRTRWPLAMPPMAGLQDIWAMRSRLRVKSAVRRAHTGGGYCGFAARVPGAHDDDVVLLGVGGGGHASIVCNGVACSAAEGGGEKPQILRVAQDDTVWGGVGRRPGWDDVVWEAGSGPYSKQGLGRTQKWRRAANCSSRSRYRLVLLALVTVPNSELPAFAPSCQVSRSGPPTEVAPVMR